MRDYMKIYGLGWDITTVPFGTQPLFTFAGTEDELMAIFDAINQAYDDLAGNPGFTTGNLQGPTKLYVLLDKQILVRYFQGVFAGTGGFLQSQQVSAFLFSGVGTTPNSQPWPFVYDSPKRSGWTNPFDGYRHKPQN
jgi:hypothetical protein